MNVAVCVTEGMFTGESGEVFLRLNVLLFRRRRPAFRVQKKTHLCETFTLHSLQAAIYRVHTHEQRVQKVALGGSGREAGLSETYMITLSGGSLGSWVDERRSKLRVVV